MPEPTANTGPGSPLTDTEMADRIDSLTEGACIEIGMGRSMNRVIRSAIVAAVAAERERWTKAVSLESACTCTAIVDPCPGCIANRERKRILDAVLPCPTPPTYRLTLKALPDPVPAPVRLRGVLKRLLRSYGFRCTDAVELPAAPATSVKSRVQPRQIREGRSRHD